MPPMQNLNVPIYAGLVPPAPSECCVVSVGVGHWYPRGIARMEESLSRFSPAVPRLLWSDSYPPGSPSHQENNYVFKYHALRLAAERYRYILWLDAADWAVAPIEPIFAFIAARKFLLPLDGWNCGQWTNDENLPVLGLTREEAFGIPQLWTNHFGFDVYEPDAQKMLAEFGRYADLRAFHGPRTNHHGESSPDPRVLGHRHDQTVLSVIAHRMGLPTVPIDLSPVKFTAAGLKDPSALVYAQGM